MNRAIFTLALLLCSCVIVEDDQPWTSYEGGGEGGGEETQGDLPLTSACTSALREGQDIVLVAEHYECGYPYYTICYSGDQLTTPGGTVCCDDDEPGATCEYAQIEVFGIPPVCPDGLIEICDF